MKKNELKNELLEQWYYEEKIAHIHGWDFSHIHKRYEEENDLPWDYYQIVKSYLVNDVRVLDIDTGGGEFLLSLNYPHQNLSATEAFPPNVELCKKTLLPLGVDFKEADAKINLPYSDNTFDVVINRHGSMNENEIYRVLKQNGVFITEQVGAENDRGLVELLYSQVPELPFPEAYLSMTKEKFQKLGLSIIQEQEVFRPIKFYDVGALVWFAHILEWEFPNFSVKNNLTGLYKAQEELEKNGVIEAEIHRYLLIAKKVSDSNHL